MNEQTQLQERTDRFQNSLLSSIEHFRNGEDNAGIDIFLSGIEDLEDVLDTYQCLSESKVKIDNLLPAVQNLYVCMQNQDIVGMIDIMEFAIYPLTKQWLEEDNEK